ncbi:MAG: sulfotransferase family protein [Verrucomicrobiales bacterium]
MSDSRQLVLVFGMHRSGTSLLTKLLVDFGYETGNEVLQAADDNPEGFWENSAVVELNDRFLQQIGSCWNDPHPLSDDAFTGEIGVKFAKQAEKLVASEFTETKLAVIKDPRMCRVFPLWQAALEKHFEEIKCIHMMRHFYEVSESLRKRNGYSHYFSNLQWIQHVLFSEIHSRPYPRLNLTFSNLLETPEVTIQKLADFLGGQALDKAGAVGKSINPSLRHNKVPASDQLPVHPASQCALELWNHWSDVPETWKSADFETDRHLKCYSELTRMIPSELRGAVADLAQPFWSQISTLKEALSKIEDPRLVASEKKLESAMKFAEKLKSNTEKLENELRGIKKGFSWKFTKPLRWIEKTICKK